MCLLVFSYRNHPKYPFIFAGNRDEFHGRPTAPAHFWEDHPTVLAGRDLKAGGTWLGISKDGRFATVTNFREPGDRRPDARSRGDLVTGFLIDEGPPEHFRKAIASTGDQYNGFNLIFGDTTQLHYVTNREGEGGFPIEPGLYGLSNGRLNTPWPKVERAKRLFQDVIASESFDAVDLLDVLADEWRPSDDLLPQTGIGLHWERAISSIFIRGDEYGTRASTVVLVDNDGFATFLERSFAPGGAIVGTERFDLTFSEAPAA